MGVLGAGLAGCAATIETFPDRPVAWREHDDTPVPRKPRPNGLEDQRVALFIRDTFTREVDRHLALELPRPAADVNALDEVPCSTWFCPRNHLDPLTPEQIAAGPPEATPPVLPLTIIEGKARGAAPGFVARDARGARFLVKLDPWGLPGLATGAEVVGTRLFHGAGYHVPGAFRLVLTDGDLLLSPDATMKLSGVAERPFTETAFQELVERAARTPQGDLTAVAVSWLPGEVLGAFDMQGRRSDDPNDRIPHEDRRSLRASYLLYGWLNVEDASSLNTLDTFVEGEHGRHVRHYLIDFGEALGSGSVQVKAVYQGREHMLELDRVLAALLSLGAYQRAWQEDAPLWRSQAWYPPAVGWYFPLETWDPADFRTGRKNPAHLRMTSRDAYWGAKVITSFTDDQIRAAVVAAAYPPEAGERLEHALRVRRDRIAARYLLPVTALERPTIRGGALCFDDIVIGRGYARPADVRYTYRALDEERRERGAGRVPATGSRTCLPLPAGVDDYLVVSVRATVRGRPAAPTRVHLRWRSAEDRLVVVGVDRDDAEAGHT